MAGDEVTRRHIVSNMSSSATSVLPAEVGAEMTKLRREAPCAPTQSFCHGYSVGKQCNPSPGVLYASTKVGGRPKLSRSVSKAGTAAPLEEEEGEGKGMGGGEGGAPRPPAPRRRSDSSALASVSGAATVAAMNKLLFEGDWHWQRTRTANTSVPSVL